MKGKLNPAKLEPPPTQPMTMSGFRVYEVKLFHGFLANYGLVHANVVQHGTERVPGVFVG